MKLQLKLIILCCCFYLKAAAQNNLVPNYSFEYFTSCPTVGSNELPLAFPWVGITTNSSDFFNACNPGIPNVPFLGGSEFQYARTGNGYAAIWGLNGFGSNYREYLQVKLDSILVQDSCYLVELHCNLTSVSRYGINKIGALLSSTAVSNVGPGLVLQHVPQIESSTFMDDTLNWMQIRGFYTAQGGEEYITIGNFRTDALTDTIHIGGSYPGSYYLIEDVRVQKISNCDTTVGMNDVFKNENLFKLYPNPNNGSMNLIYSMDDLSKGEFIIYDIAGKVIDTYTLQQGENNQLLINETGLSNGIYFYKILINGAMKAADRLIIIK